MSAIIATHNKKLLSKKLPNENEETPKKCNCRKKPECPLDGRCCEKCIVYKAEIEIENTVKNYIGCTQDMFKTRYSNHKQSFKDKKLKNSTTLSALVWDKNLNPNPKIKWSVLKKSCKYTPGNRYCDVCISEKTEILKASADKNNINKRSDIASLCVHRNKHKLDRFSKE